MNKTRIYCVSDGNTDRLVRATSRSQAIGHVARSTYKSRVATQDDIVVAIESGQKVEDASAEATTSTDSE
jgi:hypothetical protein